MTTWSAARAGGGLIRIDRSVQVAAAWCSSTNTSVRGGRPGQTHLFQLQAAAMLPRPLSTFRNARRFSNRGRASPRRQPRRSAVSAASSDSRCSRSWSGMSANGCWRFPKFGRSRTRCDLECSPMTRSPPQLTQSGRTFFNWLAFHPGHRPVGEISDFRLLISEFREF